MDRFPLQVHLEPSDISEVTSRRVTAYTQALERLAQTPGWDNVDEDQQKKLAAPLERGTTRDQERVPIPQLRSELDACETRLQDAKLRRLVAARKTAISLSISHV